MLLFNESISYSLIGFCSVSVTHVGGTVRDGYASSSWAFVLADIDGFSRM